MFKFLSLQTRRSSGFTLMELMIVVFIISVLAAVAIPMVGKYLKKSKTSEATLNLRKIYDGQVAYFQEEHTLSTGINASKTFIEAPATPLTPSTQKQVGNFEVDSWRSLKFSADGPVLYSYSSLQGGIGLTSSFTARAEGNIDGDTQTSLFERVASVDATSGEVSGGAAIFMLDPIE